MNQYITQFLLLPIAAEFVHCTSLVLSLRNIRPDLIKHDTESKLCVMYDMNAPVHCSLTLPRADIQQTIKYRRLIILDVWNEVDNCRINCCRNSFASSFLGILLSADQNLFVELGNYTRSWCLFCSGAINLEELQSLLKNSIMIRRLKRDVLTQLPAKQRQKISFRLKESDVKRVNAFSSYLAVQFIVHCCAVGVNAKQWPFVVTIKLYSWLEEIK